MNIKRDRHHRFSAMTATFALALSWLFVSAYAQTAVPSPVGAGETPVVQPVDSIVQPVDSVAHVSAAEKKGLTVSLITCSPGPEIYELYGHEAIRIKGEGIDSVWNYGVFDFRQPNFVYRFVKGETDYMCAGYPFEHFLPEYQERGSRVVEQELDLSQEEAQRLLKMLQKNSLPENRVYRYNYVKDNCSTRIWKMVEGASDNTITYPDSVLYGTYRNEMRHYNRNYPWYQFGIDLVLGHQIDSAINAKDEMFVPVEMERMFASAKFSDGSPVVKATNILNEGKGDVTLPPTPWWLSPLLWSCIVAVILVATAIGDLFNKRVTRWLYSLWFFILGVAGCVVTFLVFFSQHEATDSNILILWLNPLQFIMAFAVWKQKRRGLPREMARYNLVADLMLLIIWPFQPQVANIAVFPLIGATWFMALAYAIIARRDSYNYYRPTSSFRSRMP